MSDTSARLFAGTSPQPEREPNRKPQSCPHFRDPADWKQPSASQVMKLHPIGLAPDVAMPQTAVAGMISKSSYGAQHATVRSIRELSAGYLPRNKISG